MSSQQPSVFVVDDDSSIREALCEYLVEWGFPTRPAASGTELDRLLSEEEPGAIVLDIMMPGEDGLAICKRLRSRYPVLMLSALSDTADRILGLELGADDYLAKPFEPRELVARLRAIIRRGSTGVPAEQREVLKFDGWVLDETAQLVAAPNGVSLRLTASEFSFLLAFASRPQRVLSRDALLQLTQGPLSELNDRAVDLAVSRLRRKLATRDGGHLIETVWGEGYRFAVGVRRSRIT